LEVIKEVGTIIVFAAMILANVYALWKWKNEFISKKDFNPKEYIKVATCSACKEAMKVADEEVKKDLQNIKTVLVDEERNIKTLGVIQIVMCRHIGMKKEEIDMFKDAIMNGADLTSLL